MYEETWNKLRKGKDKLADDSEFRGRENLHRRISFRTTFSRDGDRRSSSDSDGWSEVDCISVESEVRKLAIFDRRSSLAMNFTIFFKFGAAVRWALLDDDCAGKAISVTRSDECQWC